MSILSKIIDSFLPPRCINCGKVIPNDDGLCEDCFQEITFISSPYCRKCGSPLYEETSSKKRLCGRCSGRKSSPYRLARSAFEYDEASKNMILSFKFWDKTENAKVLGKCLTIASKDILEEGADIIVPIPLHFTRLFKRRYNQSALLARELSKLTGLKVDFISVIRHKKTRPQVEFSGRARVKNVRGAFSVKNIDKIKGQRIILIDDVMTTGSTLMECAKALNKAGAKSVDFLTVARVTR